MAGAMSIKNIMNSLIHGYGINVTVETLIECRMAAYEDTIEDAALAIGSVVYDPESLITSMRILSRTLEARGSELRKALPF